MYQNNNFNQNYKPVSTLGFQLIKQLILLILYPFIKLFKAIQKYIIFKKNHE